MRYSPQAYTIRADEQAAANAALKVAGLGAPFSVALVPASRANREPPATHYACGGMLSEVQVRKMQTTLNAAGIPFERSIPEAGKTAFAVALERREAARAKTEDSP